MLKKYENLKSYLLSNLFEHPYPFKLIDVPYFYKDTDSHNKIQRMLEKDTEICYSFALAYYLQKKSNITFPDPSTEVNLLIVKDFIKRWSEKNQGVIEKGDGPLSYCTRLQNFITAALLLKWSGENLNDTVFDTWLKTVYIPICEKFSNSWIHKWNNHGSWALFALLQSYLYLGDKEKIEYYIQKIQKHWKLNIKKIPFISKDGELWIENLRNNKGMYYTWFSIFPILKASILLKKEGYDLGIDMLPQLEKLYEYFQNPSSWKYTPIKIPPFSWIQNIVFPGGKTLRALQEDEIILFILAGKHYNIDKWINLNEKYPSLDSTRAFRHGSIIFDIFE